MLPALISKHVLLLWWPLTETRMYVLLLLCYFVICINLCLLGIKYQSINDKDNDDDNNDSDENVTPI